MDKLQKGTRVKVLTTMGINALHYGQEHEVIGESRLNGTKRPDGSVVEDYFLEPVPWGHIVLVERRSLEVI